jgi:hypothetical protein
VGNGVARCISHSPCALTSKVRLSIGLWRGLSRKTNVQALVILAVRQTSARECGHPQQLISSTRSRQRMGGMLNYYRAAQEIERTRGGVLVQYAHSLSNFSVEFAKSLRDSDDPQAWREPGKHVSGTVVLGYTLSTLSFGDGQP